ncbi:UDP-N-acetylglucosamine 2-epimerase [Ascidiimonas aurantiaca]|uniref:UDP-N-acetylglucosamine 2-epimerase n=1 Tax=Ascidiimonas aurantiaca TaxID=1685432 RepID=UPI0030ECD12F
METKKIIFLTGTRADFGKIKSLITILEGQKEFEVHVFVTGMHLMKTYGYTLLEIERCGFKNINTFENYTSETSMELTLAKTIEGFSQYVKKTRPDLIVVHGDRVETLAGAITGSLNNILVAHIEGGEISGTVDELIRHSVTKMSHIHFVANDTARNRLIQMGEVPESIFKIGSPDVDIMFSDTLPLLTEAKAYYEIEFPVYAMAMFHPVTTEASQMKEYATNFIEALIQSKQQYVVIYPNNDMGSSAILAAYDRIKANKHFRVFPSLRFEYFLTLLKHARFIIGNSSAGIREAPYYGVPTINIGTRQENRALHAHIVNTSYEKTDIIKAIESDLQTGTSHANEFGSGNSAKTFLSCLKTNTFWNINAQKQFLDRL